MGGRAYLIGCALVAGLGGLLFGFDTAVINGTTDALTREYGLSPGGLGFTVASALIGTILGSLMAGPPADRFGRRGVLKAVGVLYFVSAVGSGLAWDWPSFLFFRFLGGIGVGGASVVSPLYIAEIAPAKSRGRLVAVAQFNIVLGILLAFVSNLVVARLGLGETEWRWMFGVEAVPAVAFFALLFLTPHSPRWLVSRGRPQEAAAVLTRLGTDTPGVSVTEEIAAIEASLGAAADRAGDSLFAPAHTRAVRLAVAIAVFNQLSGINAILYYAKSIFEQAGAGKDSALAQAVLIGGTNLVFTMLAMAVIDRLGRRTLMLVGSLGYIVSLSVVAAAFYTYGTQFTRTGSLIVLAGLVAFIAAHAFGQGAVIWVFIGEIFPNRVRARGQALGGFTHWVLAAAVSWTFPIFAERSGAHAFAFYAVMMVGQLIWVLRAMPETKGVPLEQMPARLGIH